MYNSKVKQRALILCILINIKYCRCFVGSISNNYPLKNSPNIPDPSKYNQLKKRNLERCEASKKFEKEKLKETDDKTKEVISMPSLDESKLNLSDKQIEIMDVDSDDKIPEIAKTRQSANETIFPIPIAPAFAPIPKAAAPAPTDIVCEPLPEKAKIGFKMGLFLDISLPDKNTAITNNMKSAFEQQFPFVTTVSLLKGTGVEEVTNWTGNGEETIQSPYLTKLEIKYLLQRNEQQWDIYQLCDPNYGNGFIVFLPKTLMPDKKDNEKLSALDFPIDGRLKKLSVSKLMDMPNQEAKINALSNLFVAEPKVDKLFYLCGHGTSGEQKPETNFIGGLNGEEYNKLGNVLTKQNCRGLVVTSCYAGGEASLPALHSADKQASFNDQPQAQPFPILVRSIGEFAAKAPLTGDIANLHHFFDTMAAFLESHEPETIENYRVMYEKAGGLSKFFENLAKIQFSESAGIREGFRPLGEGGKAYSITYTKLKGTELSPLNKTKDIPIKDKDYLLIHPLIVDTPISVEGCSPSLLSMVPGNAHHFFKSIAVGKLDPIGLINSTLFRNEEIKAAKGFFIESINSESRNLQEVVILIKPKQPKASIECVYKEGDKYYYYIPSTRDVFGDYIREIKKEITKEDHANFFSSSKESTRVTKEAIQAATAGQESEEMFEEAIAQSKFSKK
jgi:hypothetical protein